MLHRLHRPKDYTAWLASNQLETLPVTVWGFIKMCARVDLPRMSFLFCTASINQCTSLIIPLVIKMIIDTMHHASSLEQRWEIIAPYFWLLPLLLFGRILVQWAAWTVSYEFRAVMPKIDFLITNYVTKHQPSFFENDYAGRIIQKSSSLYTGGRTVIDVAIWGWGPALVYFIVSLILIADVSPLLSLFGLCWLVISFTLAWIAGHKINSAARAVNENRSRYVGLYADIISNVRNVFLFASRSREEMLLVKQENVIIDKVQYWYLTLMNVRVVNQFISLIGMLGLVGGAVYLWSINQATAGDIALVSTLGILVMQRVGEMAENLPDLLDTIATTQDSLDTLVKPRTLLDAADAKPLQVTQGEIQLRDVGYSYGESTASVFNNFNLNIKAGERVGLVGPSGAGKSTLISLLLRLYDIQHGQILIDGQDIKSVTQESLRQQISFIPQDTVLFHRTIKENIAYGKPDASDAEIIAAAKAAEAHVFISALPQGYDTLVGERGVKLSGGQRQRVAIARALLKHAPILILDEATSALDSEAEAEIQKAISTAMQSKTVLAIAHRLSTIAHLDRLIIMDNGQIIETGTHAELLAKNGLYARLWQRQSGGFLAEKIEE